MTALPDTDRLLRRIYAARAAQQGLNQTWEKLPAHVREYWRDLIDVVRPVILEDEMRAEACGNKVDIPA